MVSSETHLKSFKSSDWQRGRGNGMEVESTEYHRQYEYNSERILNRYSESKSQKALEWQGLSGLTLSTKGNNTKRKAGT